MVEPLLALAAADPLGRPRLAGGGGVGGGVSGGADFAALAGAASYSAILFGPPGTAKTTVVAAIAARLGWGLVTARRTHPTTDTLPSPRPLPIVT